MISLLRKTNVELGGNRHFDLGCDVGRQVRSVAVHPEFSSLQTLNLSKPFFGYTSQAVYETKQMEPDYPLAHFGRGRFFKNLPALLMEFNYLIIGIDQPSMIRHILAGYPLTFQLVHHIMKVAGNFVGVQRFLKCVDACRAVSYTHLTLPTKA